jgi:hypothetical protein
LDYNNDLDPKTKAICDNKIIEEEEGGTRTRNATIDDQQSAIQGAAKTRI